MGRMPRLLRVFNLTNDHTYCRCYPTGSQKLIVVIIFDWLCKGTLLVMISIQSRDRVLTGSLLVWVDIASRIRVAFSLVCNDDYLLLPLWFRAYKTDCVDFGRWGLRCHCLYFQELFRPPYLPFWHRMHYGKAMLHIKGDSSWGKHCCSFSFCLVHLLINTGP